MTVPKPARVRCNEPNDCLGLLCASLSDFPCPVLLCYAPLRYSGLCPRLGWLAAADGDVCAKPKPKAPMTETAYRVLLIGLASDGPGPAADSTDASPQLHMRACRHVDGVQCVTLTKGGI